MTDRAALDAPRGNLAAGGLEQVSQGSRHDLAAPRHSMTPASESTLLQRFQAVRRASERLADPLSAEDQAAQSMPDASPAKWHLAHTTWFFETFVLQPRGYAPYDPMFGYLFNSYYEALGERQPRPHRGLLTRPSCAQVAAYRRHVDAAMTGVLAQAEPDAAFTGLMELGFAHEEQHQELLLMDIQHLFAQNVLRPAYRPREQPTPLSKAALGKTALGKAPPSGFLDFPGGLVEIGDPGQAFAFDNERPRHLTYLRPYRLADRPVVNGEWLAFMEDGGYLRPELWLSDGWATVQDQAWQSPLYWERSDSGWRRFGLNGLSMVDPAAPVVHVSYYEADAYARWSGRRLPTEGEWEAASLAAVDPGAFMEDDVLSPPLITKASGCPRCSAACGNGRLAPM